MSGNTISRRILAFLLRWNAALPSAYLVVAIEDICGAVPGGMSTS